MQYSVFHRSKYKDQASEIRCPSNQLGLIVKYIKEHPEKRYNIIYDEDKDPIPKLIEQVDLVKDITPNYTIEVSKITTLQTLIATDYNAYLRHPVTDEETLDNLLHLGVSDVYIDGPLGFEIDFLTKRKGQAFIRTSPCLSANASLAPNSKSNATSFFIRPEDLHLYQSAIDIIDFKEKDQDKEDTLFQIYNRGTFNFNLQDLIPQLHIEVPNLFIKPDFAENRLNCGQRCFRCHLCETQLALASKLVRYFDRRIIELKK